MMDILAVAMNALAVLLIIWLLVLHRRERNEEESDR
jgi:hypothetical protein